MAALEAEVERGQYASIQAGTFLLLEKLRVLALRRLVKRCHLVCAALDPAKQSQLPLSKSLVCVYVCGKIVPACVSLIKRSQPLTLAERPTSPQLAYVRYMTGQAQTADLSYPESGGA